MSATKTTTWALRCDHADDGRRCTSGLHVDGAADAEQVGAFAAERGWATCTTGHRCPKHTEVTR